jgi:predicted ArsR family transcriptional regulator
MFVDRLSIVDVDVLSALADPTRRRVYEYVAREARAVSREETASALGIGRTLAAYHLDRLAAEGLLSVSYERRTGRTGPGAGRPAKVYTRAERELAISVPQRDYELVARLLADAMAQGGTFQALRGAAEAQGREIAAGDLEQLLRARGYEPYHDEQGVLRMRNCPFRAVAQRHPDVVCDMNVALLAGLLDGLGARDAEAVLDPRPGRCCVAITGLRQNPAP